MPLDTRPAVIEFVEQTYFGNVQRQDIDAVMDCFNPEAEVFIRHGDNPLRHFSADPASGIDYLRDFYSHLCGNYEIQFDRFQHFVDLEAQRSACYFRVRLQPLPDGQYADAGLQELNNCNFFEYADGRIGHMIIYYSNTGSDRDAPTGYPRQEGAK